MLPHGESCMFQGCADSFPEFQIQTPDRNDGPFSLTAMEREDDSGSFHDFHSKGFVKTGAGQMQPPVAADFQPLETVKRMFSGGNGFGNFRGSGLNAAAMGSYNGYLEKAGSNQDAVINPFLFVMAEVQEITVRVPTSFCALLRRRRGGKVDPL
jgi:hypothetical protein